jgi:hypothetical protein
LKKNLLIGLLIGASLIFSGCSDKKLNEKDKGAYTTGTVSPGVAIGQKLKDFAIADQFGNINKLTNETKKVIFVATKASGHVARNYFKSQSKDYLPSRDIIFIADVSGMPSIIYKMFALPDFKKSSYSVSLLLDDSRAKEFINEKHKNTIMIISLNHKIITGVKFVTNEKDLIKEIN